MKKLLIAAVLLLSVGCSETPQGPIRGSELTRRVAQIRKRNQAKAWNNAFTYGAACSTIVTTGLLLCFLSWLAKQPYNGKIGKLEGWDEISKNRNSPKPQDNSTTEPKDESSMA